MIDPSGVPIAIVRPGKVFAAREPFIIRTVLGSCVAVCLYDRTAGVGGMNHFMLPGHNYEQDPELPARYGVHAMELLINALYRLGADRRRLEAMAFGGADVLAVHHGSLSVAQANVKFVREFLATEKIPVEKYLLGGRRALRVSFWSVTADVMVELVGRGIVEKIVDKETRLVSTLDRRSQRWPARQVTFF